MAPRTSGKGRSSEASDRSFKAPQGQLGLVLGPPGPLQGRVCGEHLCICAHPGFCSMKASLLLALLCLGAASAAPKPDSQLHAQWHEWKARHGKSYSEEEEGQRRAVWEENLRTIQLHNAEHGLGRRSFRMEMNAFGDMTPEEFLQRRGGFTAQRSTKGPVFHQPLGGPVPEAVDWRKKGYVTAVKDQGRCGSCWAFSATGALEGQMFRKTGQLVSLSEQNLVDCSRPQGNKGCKGGIVNAAFQYVKDNGGLDSEKSYPYEAKDGPCRYKPGSAVANDTGLVQVPAQEKALMEAVASVGPIAVAIDASQLSFQFYKDGIYYEPACSSRHLNHAVLVVGYGSEGKTSDGNKYWLVKNSWGARWGMDGYVKMAKDRNNACGIASEASYPTV